jgi:hypothetical protein
MMGRKVPAVLILSILWIVSGCGKNDCALVPSVNVLERISLVEHPQLLIPGQSAVLNRGGVAGLIVYNTGKGYIAYDRMSTAEQSSNCAVEVEAGSPIAKDPCSGATYILSNGSPAAVASCPLRAYRAVKSGETIVVSN